MSSCCSPERRSPTEPESAPQQAELTGGLPATIEAEREALAKESTQELRLLGLSGGTFLMGSDSAHSYSEDLEGPVREVKVEPFALSATAVTVAEFAAFIHATGYRTDAELHGSSLVFAGMLPERERTSYRAVEQTPWWLDVPGAFWLHSAGPGSSNRVQANHPVTHVSHRDAESYATWLGCRLPLEQEWEFAARGGLQQQPYPWGNVREPQGKPRMNSFQGEFPHFPRGHVGTVAVDSYSPNAYGFYNMTGNVWEWTASAISDSDSRPVMRGGSYMCHPSYCRRYRTSARTSATAETSLGHTGFRIAISQ